MNFQSGTGNCKESTDYQKGGNYTQILAKNYVPDNYSEYGLIPNSVGKSQYQPTNYVQSQDTLNKNNGGVFYQVAAGKKHHSKYAQKGGDSNYGATGLPNRFYDGTIPAGTSCNYGENVNMNVGNFDLVPHGPRCTTGGAKKKVSKKKKTPKKKSTKKTTPKKKSTKKKTPKKKSTKKTTPKKKSTKKRSTRKTQRGGKISDGVTEPLKLSVNTWESLNSFITGLEKKATSFYDEMSSMSLPVTESFKSNKQSGGKMKQFEKYISNLNKAMSDFQKEVKKMNQNGGSINFANGKNLDSPITSNHPVQLSTLHEPTGFSNNLSTNLELKSGGAKKRKTTPKKKKVAKKTNKKVIKSKRSPKKKF